MNSMEGDSMKEDLRFKATSGFAKVLAWGIFVVCTVLMVVNRKKKKEE